MKQSEIFTFLIFLMIVITWLGFYHDPSKAREYVFEPSQWKSSPVVYYSLERGWYKVGTFSKSNHGDWQMMVKIDE